MYLTRIVKCCYNVVWFILIITYGTAITVAENKSVIWESRVTYGVSIVRIWEKINYIITSLRCISLDRLSERNCVEIVQRLLDLQLIEVIYTVDGKEYLTPQELAKEIREELTVRGGGLRLGCWMKCLGDWKTYHSTVFF